MTGRWADFGPDDLVDDIAAAQLLCISVHTARAWRSGDRARGPRFIRVGAAIRYRVSDLKRFVERNTVSTIDDPVAEGQPFIRSVK